MPTHYINEMLGLPELNVIHIQHTGKDELHIYAEPLEEKQSCPCCGSREQVIRKGIRGLRRVRHLPAFEKKTYLHLPALRMKCTHCDLLFVWDYGFVGPKQRYSFPFHSSTVEQALGSTATHSARIQQIPVSTAQAMHNEAIPVEAQQIYEQVWEEAEACSKLVLGVDDFAIKKGHSYNTGIHNLKGEMLLDILPGRKLEDLRAYAQQHPSFLLLAPKAVVMDLAQAYHTWISECFPYAVRIADRFHVHGYVIDCVQEIRRTVQQTLSPRAKGFLKVHHRLLNPPADTLNAKSKEQLDLLLNYSPLLRSVWEWKEAFSIWYDCSPSYAIAKLCFIRWCEQGQQINHVVVDNTLRTLRNWQEEIVNYHRCRWTNASVEGRYNRIKAFQRRHYFTRNRNRYKAGILIECNRLRLLN